MGGALAVRHGSHYDVAIMMARTQIALDPEHHRRARDRAAALGISLAQYIRTLVARDVDPIKPLANPDALFDLGDSGGGRVERDKRAWVGEAIGAQRGKRPRKNRR